MANFDSGVSKYIVAAANVRVFFPVDWKGNAEIACKHCPYLVRSKQICGLNFEIVNYPEKYVGHECPLVQVEVKENV